MESVCGLAMLATLAGFLALLSGLLLLLLPVLIQELSRPRDSAWGAVVLLLGLVLVTSSERLTGAPMLAVLCAGLLIGRLGGEVAQARWHALSQEERLQLGSLDRWQRSLNQLAASFASLLQAALALAAAAQSQLAQRRQGQGRSHGKRWVRREENSASAPQPAGEPAMSEPATTPPEIADAAAPLPAAPLPAAPLPADLLPPIAAPDGLLGPGDAVDPSPASPTGAVGAVALPGPAPGMSSPRNAAGSAGAGPAGTAPIHISDFSEVDALLDQAAEGGDPG